MLQRISRIIAPYAASIAALALTTGVALVLVRSSAPNPLLSAIYLLLVLGTAWWGGYGPGILTAVLGVTVIPYVLVPGFTLARVNWTQVVLVSIISALVSRVASTRNEREAMLRELNDQLDERVRARTRELESANASLQEREALLLRQSHELARSNTDLQQFAYIASHDLQEPLRLIGIYSELLKRRYAGQIDAEADSFLNVIVDGVRRMETMIRDLLSYSHAIHGTEPEALQNVDLGQVLTAVVANLEAPIRESGAVIDWSGLPLVAGRAPEIMQILQNLISNAIKYRGPETPRVEIAARLDGGECVVSVRDNGIGIPAEYHETIFHPFKRLHGREYPGTGIGLALCRRIVERSGGRIWVESQPGSGSAFFFSLPQQAQTRAATAPPRSV